MKWYWVIGNSKSVKNPLIADVGDLGAIDEGDLLCKGRVSSWPSNAWVGSSCAGNDGDADDALQNLYGLPIFSPRLQSALLANGIQDIQWLPLTVQRSDSLALKGFAVANLLCCRSALDLDRSRVSRFPDNWIVPERIGEISGIQRAVLKGEMVADSNIMRLAEFPPAIYVSGKFRQIFRKGAFTGLDFVEVAVSKSSFGDVI